MFEVIEDKRSEQDMENIFKKGLVKCYMFLIEGKI